MKKRTQEWSGDLISNLFVTFHSISRDDEIRKKQGPVGQRCVLTSLFACACLRVHISVCVLVRLCVNVCWLVCVGAHGHECACVSNN